MPLFKHGYQRRYEQEKDDPHQWWYGDLSNDETVQQIIVARLGHEPPQPYSLA
ncbi:hypothetical protein [Larkinella harenae]